MSQQTPTFTFEQLVALEDRSIELDASGFGFDYQNQAWVENGRYVRCGHLDAHNCDCYGKTHEGEAVKL